MKTPSISTALILFIMSNIFISCSKGKPENETSYKAADSTSIVGDNSNLTKNEDLKNKQFIRTADSKFRVKDVKRTTQQIQDLTAQFGGYVSLMSLKSEPTSIQQVEISADSVLKVAEFTVNNTLTIRVPNQQLDSLLRGVFKMVEYWDSCELKTDDATLAILGNSLKIKRLNNFSTRNKTNIDDKKGNITIASDAEEVVLSSENKADNYQIERQNIINQVKFSVVNLHIYQAQSIQKTLMPSIKNIEAYRPNIFIQLWDSLQFGWQALETLLVFLMKLWPLWIIGLMIYYFLRRKTLKAL